MCVIVLNWNGWNDTRECLESLLQVAHRPLALMVVDNGSTDDSVEQLRRWAAGQDIELTDAREGQGLSGEAFWQRTVLLHLPENRGFAGGFNAGLRLALAQPEMTHCVVLNNDTIVEPGFLAPLLQAAAPEDVALVGGRIVYHHDPRVTWYGGGHIDWRKVQSVHWDDLNQAASGPVAVGFVTGCMFLVTRALLQRVGPLPEHYFIYYEDVDYCARIARAGGRLLYEPRSTIRHKVGATMGTLETSPRTAFLATRNRLWLARRYLARWALVRAVCFVVGTRLLKVVAALLRGRTGVASAMLRGIRMGLGPRTSEVAR